MHLGPIINRYLFYFCDDEELLLLSFVSVAYLKVSNTNSAVPGGVESPEPL